MMAFFGRLLNRAILSHLLVAVPPAFILGKMVIDINESALRLEVQRVHLALASELRDRIEGRVQLTAAVLGHAERVLDLSELTIEARQDVLRALVADGQIPHLAIYTPDGAFDSSIVEKTDTTVSRGSLDADLRSTITKRGLAPRTTDDGQTMLVVPWTRGDDVLGFLGTTLDTRDLRQHVLDLASGHLDGAGTVDVVDAKQQYVVSSVRPSGERAAVGTPFASIRADGGELTKLEAGISTVFVSTDGEEHLAAVMSSPTLGWLVSVSRPSTVAFASIERVKKRVLLMSLVAALAAGIVGLLMARRVSGPISALIAQVQRTARRGFNKNEAVTADGELGQLARAFNGALDELDRYREDVRSTTQLRLRLGRFVSKGAMHELLASQETKETAGPAEPVTVLFADVIHQKRDGTSEELGTEHLVSILSEFFSAAHEALAAHGGRLDRFSGDAVIGIFRFEDRERAARAALDAAQLLVHDAEAIADRWADRAHLELTASVGVVSDAAVLQRADDDPNVVTVTGPIVDAAAELQKAAAPGTVRIDSTTRTLSKADAATVDDSDSYVVRRGLP